MTKNILAERGEAKVEIVVGALQEVVGRVIGNDTMQAKGAAHRVTGHARDDAARLTKPVATRAEGAVEVAAGAVQAAVGTAIGDDTLKAKGDAHKVVGKAKNVAASRVARKAGKTREIAGNAEAKAGSIVGNPVRQVVGTAQELAGKAQQAMSKR